MNKPPAFQFYADDFLAGTMKFTDAEVGLYARLLCAQWSEGGLPCDNLELSSYGKGDTPVERVKAKFKLCDDGLLRNERMEIEREKQRKYRETRALNGKLGGRPDKAHGKHMVSSDEPKPKAKKSSPSPSPSPIKATKLPSKALEVLGLMKEALGDQWINDAGKWVNRVKSEFGKTERVCAEVGLAIREGRIKTSPAQYAEQIWKEFA